MFFRASCFGDYSKGGLSATPFFSLLAQTSKCTNVAVGPALRSPLALRAIALHHGGVRVLKLV